MPYIHGIEAHKRNVAVTRSWQMRLPKEVDRIIIDTPASISGSTLSDYIRQADTIIIPVLPSPIDIHTTTNFIKEIMVLGKLQATVRGSGHKSKTRLAVVANRIKENTRVFKTLENFLAELDLPIVTALADSQYYIHAFVDGIGIHELRDARTQLLCQQWKPLLDWIDDTPGNPVNLANYQHSYQMF